MFAFNFVDGDSAEATESNAPECADTLRAAREEYPSSADISTFEQWQTASVSVGSGSSTVELCKRTLPESDALALLQAEQDASTMTAGAQNPGGRSDVSSHEQLLACSDLVPNVYEGGFKLWECAYDLMQVMHDMAGSGELTFKGAAVLEAGCGAGLPGALAAKLGAAAVVMQDFNAAVLHAATMPTMQLSDLWEHVQDGRMRFVSGDWARIAAFLGGADAAAAAEAGGGSTSAAAEERSGGGVDIILSADTIYSLSAAPRLWQLVTEVLRPGGTAIFAAKSYYFGVGGSVSAFKALVAADARFECRSLRTFEDGSSNRRECFEVRRLLGGCSRAHTIEPVSRDLESRA